MRRQEERSQSPFGDAAATGHAQHDLHASQAVDGRPGRGVPPKPTKPKMVLELSEDHMTATLTLHPTGPNTLPPQREDIAPLFLEAGVVVGINMTLLDELCARPVFYQPMAVASGVFPAFGEDGRVDYLVNLSPHRRPLILEDGIADYNNPGLYRAVRRGQPLCVVHPAVRGEDGMDLLGNVLEGGFGAEPLDPMGTNTEYAEDGHTLLAAIDGHVSITYGIVEVVEVLTVDSGVDNATGNIDFTGDVVVGGDVAAGFSIKCGGSIVVEGSVEGAVLEAGTDINVTAGVSGMDKGLILAGGSITCKYIQNCNVRATGSIQAESILFSKVECGGDLELVGAKAALIGGSVTVGGKVTAKTIGTAKSVPTWINLPAPGAEPDEVIKKINSRLAAMDEEIGKTLQLLALYEERNRSRRLSVEQNREIASATDYYLSCVRQRETALSQLGKIRTARRSDGDNVHRVVCSGTIYGNTRVAFGAVNATIQDPVEGKRVELVEGAVAVLELL